MSTPSQNHNLTRSVACAIYLRISLDPTGEGLGVARQEPACQRIAAERGWSVAATYSDNSVSASKESVRRPAYEQMRADFEAGRFAAIVCWDLDRLTRQPMQLEYWIKRAETGGLKIATASGESDLTNGDNIMLARMMLAVRRNEVDKKSARQKLANAQRLDRGLLHGGTRVTGYTSAGEVIDEEAKVVHRVFDAFERGESVKSICEGLQRDSVPTRVGRPWSRSSVHDILTNAKYAGRQTSNRLPTGTAGTWEPIVSEAQFDAVQVIFADPARQRLRRGTDRRYLGSGLFLCGICQREVQVYGNGPTYGCVVCGKYKSVKPVDVIVRNVIVDRLARTDVLALVNPRDDARVRALTDRTAELRRRLATVEADYDSGLIDGRRFAVASGRVQLELAHVEKERATAVAGKTVGSMLTASDPGTRFLTAPLMVQRSVLDALLWVVLLPSSSPSRRFQPETVSVRWRRTRMEWQDGFLPIPEVSSGSVAALR